jgi:hypothetical protein
MKSFACSLALACTFATSAAQAQPAAESRAGIIGVDAMIVLPVGDYGDGTELALGPIGRAEFPAGPGYITGRFGVLYHLTEVDDTTLLFLPLYGGFRYPIGGGQAYVAGEIGITIGYLRADTPLGSGSDTDTELGMSLSAGLRKGQLDLRGGLFLPDLDDLVAIFGSVGFDFASF